MKNAIILHGKPTKERYEKALIDPHEPMPHEANWLPWLGKQLSDQGVEVSIPVLPLPYYPVFRDWNAVFLKDTVGKETSLIGHSAGAEFLLRWFSENERAVADHLVLVAPYKDYDGKYRDFSKYTLDRDLVVRVGRLTIVYSSDDDEPILRRSQELIEVCPKAEVHVLEGFGHFRIGHNMTGEAFPELLYLLAI